MLESFYGSGEYDKTHVSVPWGIDISAAHFPGGLLLTTIDKCAVLSARLATNAYNFNHLPEEG